MQPYSLNLEILLLGLSLELPSHHQSHQSHQGHRRFWGNFAGPKVKTLRHNGDRPAPTCAHQETITHLRLHGWK